MISVLVVDADQDFVKEIGWALATRTDIEFFAITRDFTELEQVISARKSQVVLAGPNLPNKSIISLVIPALRRFARLGLVCSTESFNQYLSGEQLEAWGVSQRLRTIGFPTDHESIVKAIDQLSQQIRERTEGEENGLVEQNSQPLESNKPGKLVTIFSAKGGVGKTIIATNLAVCLAQRFRSDVSLIDLDLQFGDVGVSLSLEPKHTVYDAFLMAETLDTKMLDDFMTTNGTGVKALLAPLEPEVADLITSSSTQKIVSLAKRNARYVIVDTPPSFNDHVLSALEASDLVYLITTMDITSVKNIKLCLQTLQLLGYPKERTGLIVNRAHRKSGLRMDEIEHSLETKTVLTLPRDKMVPLAANQGMPVVTKAPKSPFSRSIYRLSQIIEALDLDDH